MRSRWASGAERRAVRRRPRRSCWRSARPRAGSPGPARVWAVRSGEGRGGEEGRFRWAPGHLKKKKKKKIGNHIAKKSLTYTDIAFDNVLYGNLSSCESSLNDDIRSVDLSQKVTLAV